MQIVKKNFGKKAKLIQIVEGMVPSSFIQVMYGTFALCTEHLRCVQNIYVMYGTGPLCTEQVRCVRNRSAVYGTGPLGSEQVRWVGTEQVRWVRNRSSVHGTGPLCTEQVRRVRNMSLEEEETVRQGRRGFHLGVLSNLPAVGGYIVVQK